MIKVITLASLSCGRCNYRKDYPTAAMAPDHCPACGYDAQGNYVWATPEVIQQERKPEWKS